MSAKKTGADKKVGYPVRIVKDGSKSDRVGDGVGIHHISVAIVLPEDETPDDELKKKEAELW